MTEKLLPSLLIIIQACASVPYFNDGNWRMGLYWCFAAGLTAVVTY